MSVTRKQARPLLAKDLQELLKLINDADSVELKLTVPDSAHRSTVAALGMDPLDGEIRQVFFFDTPDLALNRHGLVLRARRVQRKADDSIVKLRPVVPDELPRHFRKFANLHIEVDAMPGGYVCSASLKAAPDDGEVKAVAAGKRPVSTLFSKEQRQFYAAYAPQGLPLDDLTPLGPINLIKLKFSAPDYARRIVAELWLYPDGSRSLELSTKCLPGEALAAAAETRAFLERHGVDLSGQQQTKTKKSLQFFSRDLKADTEMQVGAGAH